MKCNSTEFRWGVNVAALLLGMSLAADGQSAQPTQEITMQQIIDRLDRLEKVNQALMGEIRALRQEVSGLRTPETGASAPAAEQSLATQPADEERQTVAQ